MLEVKFFVWRNDLNKAGLLDWLMLRIIIKTLQNIIANWLAIVSFISKNLHQAKSPAHW